MKEQNVFYFKCVGDKFGGGRWWGSVVAEDLLLATSKLMQYLNSKGIPASDYEIISSEEVGKVPFGSPIDLL